MVGMFDFPENGNSSLTFLIGRCWILAVEQTAPQQLLTDMANDFL